MRNEVCLGFFLNSKRYNTMGRMFEFVGKTKGEEDDDGEC